MSSFTITNTDDAILTALDTTLTAARETGIGLLFAQVVSAGSVEEAKQTLLKESATAVLVYASTTDHKISDLEWGQLCHVDIVLAVKANTQALRQTAITRLIAGTKTAVETDQPSDTAGFLSEGDFHRRLEWGEPSLDLLTNLPWAVAVLPLSVAYVIATRLSR
ncbi:MAG TPA: hypothetical protein VM238_22510 [Phycisphaerae bacterium]|nr:hypothetical protein [Phycisphaerae bacterium]